MTDKHEKKEEAYYVGIANATLLRKQVLETAKVAVSTIHNHNRIRQIQDEKLKFRTELTHLLRHMHEDMRKLEAVLPKRDMTLPPMAQQVVAKRKGPMSDSRLDKIELALSEIEARLKSL